MCVIKYKHFYHQKIFKYIYSEVNSNTKFLLDVVMSSEWCLRQGQLN